MPSFPAFFLFILLAVVLNESSADGINSVSNWREVLEFNAACDHDSCDNNQTDKILTRSCDCDVHCVQLGTCCLDSSYANITPPKLKPVCQPVYNSGTYFVIDQCPNNNNSISSHLCNDQWNGDNNLQKLVPVTSLSTSLTYKNYFCFRCHEENDEFMYWKIKIEGNFGEREIPPNEIKQSSNKNFLIYDTDMDMWMASNDQYDEYSPVKLSLVIPVEVKHLTHECEPDVISDCFDEWSDEDVRNKCHSYMAIKEIEKYGVSIKYKNIHCAFCNFEDLNDIICRQQHTKEKRDTDDDNVKSVKRPFSFSLFLDLNIDDLSTNNQKCSEDQLWDPFMKNCKKISCALPGYILKNGICVKEELNHSKEKRDTDSVQGKSVKRLFSFPLLPDFNNEELSTNNQNCSEDQLWDPFMKKCRKISCVLPGYILKRGRCVKEELRLTKKKRDTDGAQVKPVKRPFSFTLPLELYPRNEEELTIKTHNCSYDQLWDPFMKKCRKIACVLPGYILKNERCVKEELNDTKEIRDMDGAQVKPFKRPFSFPLFHYPLSEELSIRSRNCSEDQIWDPFIKKCRKVSCLLPGFILKNRKCVKEELNHTKEIRDMDGAQVEPIKRQFSFPLFHYPRHEELSIRNQNCSQDQFWDPFFKKCRKVSCALPGYVLKNGRCVKEELDLPTDQ